MIPQSIPVVRGVIFTGLCSLRVTNFAGFLTRRFAHRRAGLMLWNGKPEEKKQCQVPDPLRTTLGLHMFCGNRDPALLINAGFYLTLFTWAP